MGKLADRVNQLYEVMEKRFPRTFVPEKRLDKYPLSEFEEFEYEFNIWFERFKYLELVQPEGVSQETYHLLTLLLLVNYFGMRDLAYNPLQDLQPLLSSLSIEQYEELDRIRNSFVFITNLRYQEINAVEEDSIFLEDFLIIFKLLRNYLIKNNNVKIMEDEYGLQRYFPDENIVLPDLAAAHLSADSAA